MLLKITHTTDLSYDQLISESVMELRMVPRQETDQYRLSFDLAIGPRTQVSSYFDWLGNTVHAFTVSPFHKNLKIVATSLVETDRPKKEPERFKDLWPLPTAAYDYRAYDYLQFAGPVLDTPELRALVNVLRPQEGIPLGEIALRILHLIDDRFRYEAGVTTAASPITEILTHKKGVCQDFAHLMIALARALKIPARYVSGYVHPDHNLYRGVLQSHAWCELLFPSAGWIGFDPTNRCIISHNFVKVALGRDFRDVPPNRGVFRGKAKEGIKVSVTTEELPSIPAELVAERHSSLDLPSYPDRQSAMTSARPDTHHQQQQQQQA